LLTTHELFAHDLRLLVLLPEKEFPLRDLSSLLLTATCDGCGRKVTFDLEDPSPNLVEEETCANCSIPDRNTAVASFTGMNQRHTRFLMLANWLAAIRAVLTNGRVTVKLGVS
jgi:hypothetical protein